MTKTNAPGGNKNQIQFMDAFLRMLKKFGLDDTLGSTNALFGVVIAEGLAQVIAPRPLDDERTDLIRLHLSRLIPTDPHEGEGVEEC